jgi:hypothetical protein
MSEIATQSHDLMPWEEQGADFGVEMNQDEVSLPRLKIIGREGVFENAASEQFTALDAVILGSLRARVMWFPEVEEGDSVPMCRSRDGVLGLPNVSDDTPPRKQFPFKDSTFERSDMGDLDGVPTLPCEECKFKEWNNATNKPGMCAEQAVLPLLYKDGMDNWQPGVLTLQRSGLKNTKRYVSQFAASRVPMFTVHTRIELDRMKRGDVDYAVPRFLRKEATDRSMWPEYWNMFTDARTILRTIRKPAEEAAPAPKGAPKSKARVDHAPSKPVVDTTPDLADVPDDDLEF